jgi:hypothetical protein
MPAWVWILIAIGIAVVVIAAVAWRRSAAKSTERLRDRFGPEYDRVVGSSESKREAESELTAREERRAGLEVRPLSEPARKRDIDSWKEAQAQFVDDPRGAVGSADTLLQLVMRERGYPVDDFEQRAADISVDYPDVVENYRSGHRLWEANKRDGASTEDLRLAMRHYRALFRRARGAWGREGRLNPASARAHNV